MTIQSILRHCRVLGILTFMTVLGAIPSWAIPVNIVIEPSGNLDGFRYSVIHTASRESGSHSGYYTGGSILYKNIAGTLSGELTGISGNLVLSGIAGTLTTDIVGASGSVTFIITGGTLAEQPNGFVDGELHYTLAGGPAMGTGTFYFDAINFMNNSTGPNRLSQTSLVLWGNNWNVEGSQGKPLTGALGMDLKGRIEAVPEPSTVLLMSTGLAGLLGWRIWKARR